MTQSLCFKCLSHSSGSSWNTSCLASSEGTWKGARAESYGHSACRHMVDSQHWLGSVSRNRWWGERRRRRKQAFPSWLKLPLVSLTWICLHRLWNRVSRIKQLFRVHGFILHSLSHRERTLWDSVKLNTFKRETHCYEDHIPQFLHSIARSGNNVVFQIHSGSLAYF